MKQIKLGRTNIVCGELGLGCEGFTQATKEEAKDYMTLALENGINYIDLYSSNPEVRKNIGYAIKGRRNEVFIQGHLCTTWKDGQYNRTRDLEQTKQSFDELLINLDTDYIDVGMIHYIDEDKDFETVFNGEIIEYAKELKSLGKVKYLGISSHNPLVAEKAAQTGLIDVIMFSVNPCYDMVPANEDCDVLWDPKTYEKQYINFDKDRLRFYELCEKNEIAITVMKAFAGGDLLDEKLSPFKKAMTPAQCISYALTRPGVKVVLTGFHNKEELLKDIEYKNANSIDKDFSCVLKTSSLFSIQNHCVYCGHCAPCPKAIDISSVNKFLDLCLAQNDVPETVLEHYLSLSHHASECIECGGCEKRCPFSVKIIEKMNKAKEIFGK